MSTSVFVGALDDHPQLLVADWKPEALIIEREAVKKKRSTTKTREEAEVQY